MADPLSRALQLAGLNNVGRIVAFGAVFSMTAVLLVFQYGQPRIFFAMARDGLLPPFAAKVHGKYRTPYITTILTGVFVASWAMIGDAGETYDLTNIGTLFAFVLVCIGVLVLRHTEPERPRPFRVPRRKGGTLVHDDRWRGRVLLRDEGTAGRHMDPLRRVARDRLGPVHSRMATAIRR